MTYSPPSFGGITDAALIAHALPSQT